jgi:hypothetical protein
MAQSKFAKATEFYFGNDTYGRRVNLARRADGQYFVRFPGVYSVGKWCKHNDPVKHPEGVTNVYTGEYIVYSAETAASVVEWGFSRLQSADPKGLRLPND